MSKIAALLGQLIISPSLVIAAEKSPLLLSSRILCETQPISSSWITTLSGNADPMFAPRLYQLHDSMTTLKNVKSPKVLSSDGQTVEMLVLGHDTNMWSLYKSTLVLTEQAGSAQMLRSFPKSLLEIYRIEEGLLHQHLPWEPLLLSLSSSWFVAPNQDGSFYSLYDLAAGTELKALASATLRDYAPAQFSASGEWLALFTTATANHHVGIVIMNISTGEMFPVPARPDMQAQLAPIFSGEDSIYWLERTKTGWTIRNWKFNESGARPDALWSTQKNVLPQLVLTHVESMDHLFFIHDNNLTELSFNSDSFQPVNETRKPWPADYELDQQDRGSPIHSLIYAPWTGDLFISLGLQGGLIAYSLNDRSWRAAGSRATGATCLNPSVGPEVIK